MAIKYYCNLCRFFDSENNFCSVKKQSPEFDNAECENYNEKSFGEDMPLNGHHSNILTADSMRSLGIIAKWLKILSIFGFMGAGYGLLMAISMITMSSYEFGYDSTNVRFGLGILIITAIVCAINVCLLNAGNMIKSAIANDSPEDMEDGLDKLSKYVNYKGILMIFMLIAGFVSLLLNVIIPGIYYIEYLINS